MDDDQIPAVLTEQEQWVAWRTEQRDGTATKVPVNPATGGYARVDDPATWTGFDAANEYVRDTDGVDGVGYVFITDGRYAGVDLDNCRDPATGEVDQWAAEIMYRLDSYTEVSPSGTGLHVILEGTVPDGGNRNDNVEMYDQDRYFTVTGAHVAGTPTTVEDRAEALQAVHAEYIAGSESEAATGAADRGDVALADRELVERAMNAENGDKFQRLWNGDISGYPSHSEADLALCGLLAFWTGGDRDRVERLFRKSGLTREKWWNRADYREMTIETALDGQTNFYDSEANT